MPEFVELGRFRYMRFGFPAGLLFFAMTAIWLGGSPDPPTYAFLAFFALLIGQSVGMALRTAHRVRLTEPELLAFTPAGRVAVPWSKLRRLEVIDRKGLGYPRRLLRVEADGVEIFVLDSVASFDLFGLPIEQGGRSNTRNTDARMAEVDAPPMGCLRRSDGPNSAIIPVTGVAPSRVAMFDASGVVLARLGNQGPLDEIWGAADPCRAGNFCAPHGLALDPNGDLYVAEVTNRSARARVSSVPAATRSRSSPHGLAGRVRATCATPRSPKARRLRAYAPTS